MPELDDTLSKEAATDDKIAISNPSLEKLTDTSDSTSPIIPQAQPQSYPPSELSVSKEQKTPLPQPIKSESTISQKQEAPQPIKSEVPVKQEQEKPSQPIKLESPASQKQEATPTTSQQSGPPVQREAAAAPSTLAPTGIPSVKSSSPADSTNRIVPPSSKSPQTREERISNILKPRSSLSTSPIFTASFKPGTREVTKSDRPTERVMKQPESKLQSAVSSSPPFKPESRNNYYSIDSIKTQGINLRIVMPIIGAVIAISMIALAFSGLLITEPEQQYSFLSKWGSYGVDDGQFDGPADVAIDTSGNVYVADSRNNRTQKFDSEGTFITMWESAGNGTGPFSGPNGIAVDSEGNVYVADYDNDKIQKFDSNGNFVTEWGSFGNGTGQFSGPNGVAVDSAGNVYVTDSYNSRIQKFDSNGNFVTEWGSHGDGNGNFSSPRGIAVDSSDTVYVADYNNDRIQKFDSNGKFVTKWGYIGNGTRNFFPNAIAVDTLDNVYVVNIDETIQKFDNNGNFVTEWGSSGDGNGQFSDPQGITVDATGNVYVADTGNNRIQVFSPS